MTAEAMQIESTPTAPSTLDTNRPSSSLLKTAELNAAGAVALAVGQVEIAMVYFTNALNAFKMDQTQNAFLPPQQTLLPSRLPTGLPIPGMQHEVLHIFDQTLAFDVYSALYNLNGTSRDCCISAILFFNMALCLHVKGTKLNQKDLLETALDYYDKCNQALTLIPASDYSNASILVFILAVWNNQGVVSFQLADKENSETCFQKVHRLATELLRNKAWNSPAFGGERNLIYQFVINFILAKAPIAAACA